MPNACDAEEERWECWKRCWEEQPERALEAVLQRVLRRGGVPAPTTLHPCSALARHVWSRLARRRVCMHAPHARELLESHLEALLGRCQDVIRAAAKPEAKAAGLCVEAVPELADEALDRLTRKPKRSYHFKTDRTDSPRALARTVLRRVILDRVKHDSRHRQDLERQEGAWDTRGEEAAGGPERSELDGLLQRLTAPQRAELVAWLGLKDLSLAQRRIEEKPILAQLGLRDFGQLSRRVNRIQCQLKRLAARQSEERT